MTKTRLSTKGQLIIPKVIRERHGWRVGTELAIEDTGDAVVIRPLGSVKATNVRDVLGCLRYRGRPKSLAEMEKAIAAAAAESR
jgi:AbrB family looped-hinge helix DNA binding protein